MNLTKKCISIAKVYPCLIHIFNQHNFNINSNIFLDCTVDVEDVENAIEEQRLGTKDIALQRPVETDGNVDS